MANINIKINKITGNVKVQPDEDITQKMTERINEICKYLLSDSSEFKKKSVFNDVYEYISIYDRILYASISNTIYACYDEHNPEEALNLIGTMNSNIESVVNYSQSTEISQRIKNTQNEKEKKDLIDTKKAILKIWDHINLAQQQYSALKQTDEEYKKKFDKSIMPIKDTIVKDLNAQLITMIGIFTALAFLIFGGISSLENIFSNPRLPLFKLMIVGSVWGLCILNLVFVFLFCVGKMTKLNFRSSQDIKASIFQKYPVVWWCNLVILSIMLISIWGYYLTKTEVHTWFDAICLNNPIATTIVGTVLIVLIILITGYNLMKVTKHTNENE